MINKKQVPLNQSLQSNQSSKHYYPQRFPDPKRQFIHSLNGYSPQAKRQNLAPYLRVLQEQLQSTTLNYQNMLQAEKRNSAERSTFLLNLVQTLRMKHAEEIENYKIQLQQVQTEQQQAEKVEDQMKNIGDGIDNIVEQSKNIQIQNEKLQKRLKQQQQKQRILDQQIAQYRKEIEQCKGKIDDWEKTNLKWNRQNKQIQNILEQAEQLMKPVFKDSQQSYSSNKLIKKETVPKERPSNICSMSGFDEENCQHCEKIKIQQLFQKYNVNN